MSPGAADLTGQVAVVTGGGRGIGRAVAASLAQAGARVAVLARTRAELDDVVAGITAGNGQARGYDADATDMGVMRAVVDEVRRDLGDPTLLFNGAGTLTQIGPLWEADPDGWWREVEVHVRGTFNACRAVVPVMVDNRRGRVVNVVSNFGVRDDPHTSAYSVAKAALFRLTGCLAAEGAGHGVTAFCVGPGLVQTRLVSDAVAGEAAQRWLPRYVALPPERFTPVERTAELLVRIAAGDADPLTGRFLHATADLDALVARSEQILQEDLLALRLRDA